MSLRHILYSVFHSSVLRHQTLHVVCLLLALSSATYTRADTGGSKPIEIYPLSQNFYDVAAGESLQQIVLQLLPNRPTQRTSLMQAIVQLNPGAFVKQNPNRLRAHVRLWLPNNPPHFAPALDAKKVQIKSFSWGQVIRRR